MVTLVTFGGGAATRLGEAHSQHGWGGPCPRLRQAAVCRARRGLCCVCLEGLEEAKELDAFWMVLCGSLGFPFNLLKRQQCGQSVEYTILEE